MKTLIRFMVGSLSTSAVLGIIIALAMVLVGILATGAIAICKIIPWQIGLAMLFILGIAINFLSEKDNGGKKILFLKEALIIKKMAESVLKGKCKAVYFEWNNNIEILGYTSRKKVPGTNKVAVYCPSTPMTATGFLYFVEENKIRESGMTTLEAAMILASGGL